MLSLPPGIIAPDKTASIERILQAALQAVDPETAVRVALALDGEVLTVSGKVYPLAQFRRIRLAGIGKAAQAMARGALSVLDNRISDGLLVTKHAEAANGGLPERIEVVLGSHPVPTESSVEGGRRMEAFLRSSSNRDLVICLISGGGSALATLPQPGVSLGDIQALTRLLLSSGATISEINTLRKHLDRVKGGGLARLANGAQMIALVLSDVVGNPLDVIASGPTVADTSTYPQALDVLAQYGLEHNAPPDILKVLKRGADGDLPETIKSGDPGLARVQNVIVAGNLQAAAAGLNQAKREGFNTLLLTTYLQGEASQAGGMLASILKQINATGQPLLRPACVVVGGETTVTLRGQGKGGRNQELALGAALALEGVHNVALISLGTDGEDGPTDAAGAVCTGDTLRLAKNESIDASHFLLENDSYTFFDRLGCLVRTGPTGTNVNDLTFLFAF